MSLQNSPRPKAVFTDRAKMALIAGLILMGFMLPGAVQSQSWVKRQYHNVTARFNGLYYAKLKHREAMEEIMLAHKDDYAQFLPVFVVSLDAAVSIEVTHELE